MIRKAYEVVADRLRDEIVSGHYREGARLDSVEKLAVRYGVGRSTIREALMTLKTQGWVEVRHGGGTFVLKTSESYRIEAPEIDNARQFKEWLELRSILETEGAALAAVRRSDNDLAELHEHIEKMIGAKTEEAMEASDVRFHLALAKAAGNELLYRSLETLFVTLSTAMRKSRRLWLFAEQSRAVRLAEEHRAIVEAVAEQNTELARSRMASHLKKVEQSLQQLTRQG